MDLPWIKYESSHCHLFKYQLLHPSILPWYWLRLWLYQVHQSLYWRARLVIPLRRFPNSDKLLWHHFPPIFVYIYLLEPANTYTQFAKDNTWAIPKVSRRTWCADNWRRLLLTMAQPNSSSAPPEPKLANSTVPSHVDSEAQSDIEEKQDVQKPPPGPPANWLGDIPDGGLQAWIQVLCGWVLFFNTWGILNTFGGMLRKCSRVSQSSTSKI